MAEPGETSRGSKSLTDLQRVELIVANLSPDQSPAEAAYEVLSAVTLIVSDMPLLRGFVLLRALLFHAERTLDAAGRKEVAQHMFMFIFPRNVNPS